jgi:hypothetical protein
MLTRRHRKRYTGEGNLIKPTTYASSEEHGLLHPTVYPRGRESSPHDGAQTSAARSSCFTTDHDGGATGCATTWTYRHDQDRLALRTLTGTKVCTRQRDRGWPKRSGLRYPLRYRLARSDTEVMAESALSSSRVVVASGLR